MSPLIEPVAKPTLSVVRAPRNTLQDFVYRQLCELILNGEIAPGQLITIQYLADAFGISAMPVREALQRLTAARVLTVISSRSIGIPPLTGERLADLRRVRLEVESLAAVWAAPTSARTRSPSFSPASPRWRRRRGSATTNSICAAIARSISRSIRPRGPTRCWRSSRTLWLQISPYFHLLHASGNYFKANEQHELMLSAMRDRDAAAVSLAVRNDIEAAYRVLVPLLESEKGKG